MANVDDLATKLKAKSAIIGQIIADSDIKQSMAGLLADKLHVDSDDVEKFKEDAAMDTSSNAVKVLNDHITYTFKPWAADATFNVYMAGPTTTADGAHYHPTLVSGGYIYQDAIPDAEPSEKSIIPQEKLDAFKQEFQAVKSKAKETGVPQVMATQNLEAKNKTTIDEIHAKLDKIAKEDKKKKYPGYGNMFIDYEEPLSMSPKKHKVKFKVDVEAEEQYQSAEPIITTQVVRQKKKLLFHIMKIGSKTATQCGDELLNVDKLWDFLSAQDCATAITHFSKNMCPDCKKTLPGNTGA